MSEICLTTSVCHAVKKKPRVWTRTVFDKGHVVAGFNAEHSKQLNFVPGNRTVGGYTCWYYERPWAVTAPGWIGVNLK